MTNAHVVSDAPEDRAAARPESANIVFEAAEKGKEYKFTQVLWRSPVPRLDCALLRLSEQPQGVDTRFAATRVSPTRIEVREYMSSAIRADAPSPSPCKTICRSITKAPQTETHRILTSAACQYRAPTETGSSGSPVFPAKGWKVVALHHAGGHSMPKLNGKAGRWPANEGIWIRSILNASRITPPHGERPQEEMRSIHKVPASNVWQLD